MFVRTEDFRTFLRLYPVVSIIVAVNFLIAIGAWFFPDLASKGIGVNILIAQGEYWRLVTPIFLHGGLGHVLFNSFSLVLFGPYLERLLGKGKFLLVYLVTGIAADIATFMLESPYYSHVGSSGAIFGLFGIYLYMVLFRKDLIDQANSQIVITILVIGLLMTFTRANINILAHLFGLISGAAIAPLFFGKPASGSPYGYNPYPARTRRNWSLPAGTGPKIVWGILIVLILIGLLNRF